MEKFYNGYVCGMSIDSNFINTTICRSNKGSGYACNKRCYVYIVFQKEPIFTRTPVLTNTRTRVMTFHIYFPFDLCE